MSLKKSLNDEELEKVAGGAYVTEDYFYYRLNGQNKRRQILADIDDVKYLADTLTQGGVTDEEIIEFFSKLCVFFGPEEDC